ncbi:hypothetical protein ACIHEI_35885 [Kitasatospora sp. NPDC051984]|uniref:hypothetical protein n=1 Tax=Kitasatospora sp. NPDC051984 TaxID=3364059 RepID=UPI0037C67F40
MPEYTVAVDVITVHVVPVEADTPEAAQAEAERLVEQDWETWHHHTEPACVGDALTEDEWAAQEAEWAPLKQTAEQQAAEGRQAPPPRPPPARARPAPSAEGTRPNPDPPERKDTPLAIHPANLLPDGRRGALPGRARPRRTDRHPWRNTVASGCPATLLEPGSEPPPAARATSPRQVAAVRTVHHRPAPAPGRA